MAVIVGRPALVHLIDRAMKASEIKWGYVGSIHYNVNVSQHNRKRTTNILEADSKKQGYWIKFNGVKLHKVFDTQSTIQHNMMSGNLWQFGPDNAPYRAYVKGLLQRLEAPFYQ